MRWILELLPHAQVQDLTKNKIKGSLTFFFYNAKLSSLVIESETHANKLSPILVFMVFLLYLYIFVYNCDCKLEIIQPMAAMLLVNRTIYLVSMICCKATQMSLAPSVGPRTYSPAM